MCSREIAEFIILLVSLKSTSKTIYTAITAAVTFNFTCKIPFAATIEFEVEIWIPLHKIF